LPRECFDVSPQEIMAENFAPLRWFTWPRGFIRIVDWNIDRGLQLPAIIGFLAEANADIVLLQEVDLNAERTRRLNIAREIAQKLRLNYVFGREFVELTQGSKRNPAWHGQATLSPWKISSPRVIHFQRQSNFWKPRWFLPTLEPFQERLGGRIALAAEVEIAGLSIVTYNLHLESRASDELRLSQLEEVVRDAAAYDATRPLTISGDLNLNASKLGVTEVLARRGFRDAAPTARVATTPPRHLLEGGRHIDWAFVRGPVLIDKSRVHNTVKGSDHYPISFDLRSSG
jgi:endonuclease/exonuclease/phosphatase family metal-dependent hydrolase